jgi:hypothetical protein
VLCTTKTRRYLYVDVGMARRVHRLVALAFLGPCPPGYQVNHKNGVKYDNRIENLEYLTPAENSRHAAEVLGRVNASRMTAEQVIAIRAKHAGGGWSLRALGREYGIDHTSVLAIVKRRSWQHVA